MPRREPSRVAAKINRYPAGHVPRRLFFWFYRRVSDASNVNSLRRHADAQFRVIAYALLNDIGDVFQRRRVLFHLIVTESDVVRKIFGDKREKSQCT